MTAVAVEPAPPEPPFGAVGPPIDPDVYRRRWIILTVLCLSLLVVGIDGTIVVVALPSFVRELGASQSELQWITDAYTIVFASLLLTAGSLGDKFGRKGALVVGLVIFGLGSLGSGLVDSSQALIVTRGRARPGRRVHHAVDAVDPDQRLPRCGAGPRHRHLGGRLGARRRDRAARRRLAARALLVGIDLPRQPAGHRGRGHARADARADLEGARAHRGSTSRRRCLSITGLTALLYGVIEAPNNGWTDTVTIVAFAIAAVLILVFILWERHTDHPMLDVRFFKDPRFSAASIAITLVFFAMFGSLFFLTQYLQFVLGYSALKAGAALIPVALVAHGRRAVEREPRAAPRHEVRRDDRAADRRGRLRRVVARDDRLRLRLDRARADDHRHRHGYRDGAGDGFDHGLAARSTRPVSVPR